MASDAIRAKFPYLSQCVYLNTASAGLSWAGQAQAAAEFYEQAKARGIGGADEWAAKTEATKADLSGLLGVHSADVHFVGSTTEALNLVALSLPLRAGDQIVVAEDEFPSVLQPWIAAQSRGVSLIRVRVPSEAQRTEALCSAVNSGVRALAVSHVHWRTGTSVDLAQLSAVCRKHDCRLIVDGVQAVGAVPVDAALADAYCASVFKWLLSGFGLGFLTLSTRLAQELRPALLGYSNEPPSRSVRYGHVNYPGLYALHATLSFLRSVGWDDIHGRVALLAERASRRLRGHGFEVLTPDRSRAGIVAIRHPDAPTVVRSLAAQSIVVEDWNPIVRVSPHFYNSEEDIDRFVEALVRAERVVA